MKSYEGTSLTIGQVYRCPISSSISSHFGQTKRRNTYLVLRRKGIILRALMWAVTSLWPQKVVCRSQIYSARAKLKLISDQATVLFEGRPLCVPFRTARLHPGS